MGDMAVSAGEELDDVEVSNASSFAGKGALHGALSMAPRLWEMERLCSN